MSDQLNAEGRYRLDVPMVWLRLDLWVLTTTRCALFIIGALFTGMIILEVVSRYLFDFSIFFINGAALFLLVWFFLLGAGLALREGSHVGVEFLTNAVSTRTGRILHSLAQALTFVFFCQMLWSGLLALPASWDQTEASTEMRLFWVTLAFPTGFGLLLYHQVAIFTSITRTRRSAAR